MCIADEHPYPRCQRCRRFALLRLPLLRAIWPLPPLPYNKDGENSAGSGDVFSQVLESSSDNLLADDSDRLAGVLVACGERGGERVDIVVDNAGEDVEATYRRNGELAMHVVPPGPPFVPVDGFSSPKLMRTSDSNTTISQRPPTTTAVSAAIAIHTLSPGI